MGYQDADDRPHAPLDDARWQESDCLWFADWNAGLTGFFRIGQNPAQGTGAVLAYVARMDGPDWRGCFTSPDRGRDDHGQRVGAAHAEARAPQVMRYRWADAACSADVTFADSFYEPRGWAKDASASGLNDTINSQGHLECTGRLTGSVTLNGEEVAIDALAHRDRSWGVRDIAMVRQHRMCTGTFGPGLSFATTVLQLANGHYHKAGFVVRDGVEEDIADVDILALVDADGVTVRGGQCRIMLGSGERLEIDCETVGGFAHIYGDSYLTSENLSVARWTGPEGVQTGFCDLECSINAQAGTGLVEAHASRGVLLENGLRLAR